MSKLNIAVVGTGIFATDTHLPKLQASEKFNIEGAFNRTKSKAEAFAQKANIKDNKVYDSLDQLFSDKSLNAMDVLLPVQQNKDVVMKAIEYGLPIAIEKPIAENLDSARKIVHASKSTSVPVMVLENWIYMESIKVLREKVFPKIGDIVGFTYRSTGAWNDSNKYLQTPWRQNPQHIGGFLSDGGVHQLALLTEVLGEVESVSALTKQIRKESGDVDTLFSTLKLKSGVIGTFTYGSAFGATDKSSTFIIYGTNGSVFYDFSKHLPKPIVTYQTGSSNESASEKFSVEFNENDLVKDEFINFAEAVEKKDKTILRSTPEKAFHHLATVAASLESASKNGDSIKVESP